MLKVFTYYADPAREFFSKSLRSLSAVLGGENLELVVMANKKIPYREVSSLNKFFSSVSLVETHVHKLPAGTSTVDENPYFVEFLLTYTDYDRLYVDPRMFFVNSFNVPEESGLFFKQHQGNLSTKLCYVKAGKQFNLAFSAVRRSSISSITEVEFTYVVKNSFIISKAISSKQVVSGKLFNDSTVQAFHSDGIVAIDTTDMHTSSSKKAQMMINDLSRKQTLIALSSIKKKSPKFQDHLQKVTTTTTTEDPIKRPFSIIITAYKTAAYIEECLDSIENQSYFKDNDDFEILVGVDSCEETLAKLMEIKHKYRNLSVYMMLENSGTYVTTNTLLSLVNTENIIRFDSDDIMKPFLIQEVANNMGRADILRLSYQNFRTDINSISGKADVAHGVMFFRKNLIDSVLGGYMPWKCAADSELIFRASQYANVISLETPVFYRRIHQESLTRRTDTGLESDVRKKYREMIKPHYAQSEVFVNRVMADYKKIF